MNTPLSPEQLALLQAALQQRRAALDAQRLSHLGGVSRAEHARELLLQDGDDAPQRDADREVDLARTDRELQDLAGIDAALGRLQRGGYGLCQDCGEAIALARLQAEPQALRCLACESLRERGQPRPASL
ncbi:MAG: TraR/DksA family transcriptional regulator [Burkholderiaceae bacterium]|nr:TraR/DksA family transcriptional regulator [Burkholderiaceae bacterium]